MKIVCAWCFRQIREVEPYHDQTLSHGICCDCFDRLLARNRLPQEQPQRTYEAQPPHGPSSPNAPPVVPPSGVGQAGTQDPKP